MDNDPDDQLDEDILYFRMAHSYLRRNLTIKIEDASFVYLYQVKKLKLKYYDELLREFESRPTKVGEKNRELLWNCHRTLFLKMGVSKVYLDNLEEILVEEETIQRKMPWDLEYYMAMAGFFTNLTGSLDLLAQEINIIYDFQYDERISFSDIVNEMDKARERIDRGMERPRNGSVKNIYQIILDFGKGTFETIAAYRNFYTHRRNIPTAFNLDYVGVGTFSADNASGSPIFFDETGNRVSETESRILKAKLDEMRLSLSPFAAKIVSFGPPLHIQRTLRLPKKDKLKLLPSELDKDEDFEEVDVYELSKTFYDETVNFIERVGENFIKMYKTL